ncbi:MAG: toll/interleukin-1 receptor domain-containing protein [Anaerolineae bacterium]|nr:toll/interleukin-1 receptor domain-containing protein [Anaerolineae bacterium]
MSVIVMRNQAFVSYSHNDNAFVKRLAFRLSEFSADLWIDDDRLRGGEDWRDAIHEALNESAVMILVVTPASMESVEVKREWTYFLGLGRPIIPLIISETPLPYSLSPLQQIVEFARQGGFELGLRRLVQALSSHGVCRENQWGGTIYKVTDPTRLQTYPVFPHDDIITERVRALNHALRLASKYEHPEWKVNHNSFNTILGSLIGNHTHHDGFLSDVQSNLTALDSWLTNRLFPSFANEFLKLFRELLYTDWIRATHLHLEKGGKMSYAIAMIPPDEELLIDLLSAAKDLSRQLEAWRQSIAALPRYAELILNHLVSRGFEIAGVAVKSKGKPIAENEKYWVEVHCGTVRIDWISEPGDEEWRRAQTIVGEFVAEQLWHLTNFGEGQ